MAPLAVIGIAAFWVWETITNWARYPAPYKWVAFYYYALVAVPLKGFASVWTCLVGTNSPSAGHIALGVGGVVAYAFVLLVAVVAAAQVLKRKFLLVVFGPAIFTLLWMAAQALFAWASK